mgnify:CR=1 FL=1
MEITNCVTQETTNAAVMGLGSNEQEMLNFAIKNGIIDLPHLQDQVETMKNAEILQNHQYKIWQGNNQKWYTYLPDGEDGRKQVKRSTKAAIEKAVIQYYRQNPKKEERKIKLLKMPTIIGVVFKILWFVTIPYASIIQTAKDILMVLHL